MAYWFLVVRSAVQAPFKISIQRTALSTAASRKLGKLHIHHMRYFKILWKRVGPEKIYGGAGNEHWLTDSLLEQGRYALKFISQHTLKHGSQHGMCIVILGICSARSCRLSRGYRGKVSKKLVRFIAQTMGEAIDINVQFVCKLLVSLNNIKIWNLMEKKIDFDEVQTHCT